MIDKLIGDISTVMYSYVLIILLLATGLYFTFRTRFVQFRMFLESIRVVGEKPEKAGATSSFQALMVSTASRVGTGNIIGISTAICAGGFGAVFWMWVIAIIGGASAFIESTLAQIYKRRDPETTPWVIGAILALLVGYCVMGGGKRIVKVTSTLVPFMGGLYVLVSLIVIVMNFGLLPQVLGRIFSEAFDFQAIFGGLAGSCLMYGIKRGLYSNEAGVGSAPNAAASANVSHPVKQGLVQMLSVFIDTLLICTATAFMLLCSGVEPDAALEGAPYVQAALSAVFGPIGPMFITVAMVLFAFTTLIGNLYYVDNCLNYIVKKVPAKEFMVLFRIDAMLLIFIGAGMQIGTVWNLADVLMGVMALINLPVIILLSRPALLALKDYTAQKNTGRNPVFKAETVGLKGKTEYWN